MKKTFIYLTFAVSAAVLAHSCVQHIEQESQVLGDEARIDLSVACVAPSTRATQAGEETYNENKITHIDWFVFSSDDATATAIEHGRETFTDKDNVTEPFTVKSINMQNHVVSNACSGYVYVIANLPDEYSHDEALGIKHTEGTTTVTDGLTLGALKTLLLTTVFDVLTSEGKFQAQDKFVMASGIIPFNLNATEKQKTVDAKLSRVASKLTLDLSVVSAIDEVVANMAGRDTLYEEYKQTWYPDVENIHIYMSYANGHTTLDKTLFGGAPETYTDANFFTFTRDSFSPTATSQEDGWKLTGTPFYSYPMKWNTQDEHAPFIKIILPWRSYVETPSYETHNYINHEGSEPHPGNKLVSATRNFINDKTAAAQEFFYKLSIPAEDNVLESNTWYKISMDVAILGGRSDDLSMEMAGRYYVVDWYEDPDFSAGGALVQGSYLKLASDTYYIYGGDSIEIPVQSSHDITTTVTGVSWLDYSTKTPTSRSSNDLANYEYLVRKPFTNDHFRTSFTFTHELMSNISQASTSNKPDVSEYTFTVEVTNAAGDSKTITIIQQPPLYINYKESNHYVFVNQYGGKTQKVSAWDENYNHDSAPQYDGWGWNSWYFDNNHTNRFLGNVVSINASFGSGNSNPNNYNIYISSLSGLNYNIGDPRVETGGSLSGLPSSLDNYKQTRQTGADNMISPAYKVASSYGMCANFDGTSGGTTYNNAVKRCAAYQENGYPAGRWRVPTEAEIEFVVTLSKSGAIPPLFDGQYWASSGRYYNSSDGSFSTAYDGRRGPVRCVYDVWYWGDTQDSAHMTSWGGYQDN